LSQNRFQALVDRQAIRPADPLFAVYDRDSGRTHLITDVSHALLQAATTPGTLEELTGRVRSSFDIESVLGDDIEALLVARAQELIDLDLLKLVS
jgi:hypothetical protein